MCEKADHGCNCHHPAHGGHRCGLPHGGPNKTGKCDFCRSGHVVVTPAETATTTTSSETTKATEKPKQ